MSKKLKILIPLILVGLSLTGQDAISQILAQTMAIERSLREQPVTGPDSTKVKANSTELIKGIREAAANHRTFESLEKLAQLLALVRSVRRSEEFRAGSGFNSFDKQWQITNQNLKAVVEQAKNRDWKRTPDGLKALVQTAIGKVGPLMAGSEGFSNANSPSDASFYLGQAEGQAEFAKFCTSLTLAKGESAFKQRSIIPELLRLQNKVNAAFVPPRSIEQHSRFIALNSALKFARELDAGRSYAGALYQYLEAVEIFGSLDAPEVDTAKERELLQELAELRENLRSPRHDDSIMEIFIERAEALLADGATPEHRRTAFVLVTQVIPAYFAERKPAAVTKQPYRGTIRLTLVRWPFT